MCSTAGPDAEENGTDGTARHGATWQPSKASAAGLGAQAKGGQGSAVRGKHRGCLLAWRVRPLALLGAERRHARGQVEQSRAGGVVVERGKGVGEKKNRGASACG